jgi:hypothetical protein
LRPSTPAAVDGERALTSEGEMMMANVWSCLVIERDSLSLI